MVGATGPVAPIMMIKPGMAFPHVKTTLDQSLRPRTWSGGSNLLRGAIDDEIAARPSAARNDRGAILVKTNPLPCFFRCSHQAARTSVENLHEDHLRND